MADGIFGRDLVRVRVPATSANLGPGFDALGLALSLYDDVSAQVIDTGLVIDVTGEGEQVGRDETHLVLRAMRATFDRLGQQPPGLTLTCTNRIPHGRGLGSSAAAIVAGTMLARALVEDGDRLLPDSDLLVLASAIEGHPDNVAACLLGGLTIAWTNPTGPTEPAGPLDRASAPEDDRSPGRTARAIRRDCDSAIAPIAFIAPSPASTEHARGLLPATVAHRDAAFAAGRSALLVAALTGSTEALFAATEDVLHQPYRAPAMPASADLVAGLRSEGVAAVISGAGPSVLALTRDPSERQRAIARAPDGWRALELGVDIDGARLTS